MRWSGEGDLSSIPLILPIVLTVSAANACLCECVRLDLVGRGVEHTFSGRCGRFLLLVPLIPKNNKTLGARTYLEYSRLSTLRCPEKGSEAS